ncbi:hypothetical protein [Neptuniibacter sp. QD37_11]|uniref:hypothetical protein n=1 Tax=Neptuniibacter sp. QD37_11 TaxID=3398209 RepID=UPI0039F5DC3A
MIKKNLTTLFCATFLLVGCTDEVTELQEKANQNHADTVNEITYWHINELDSFRSMLDIKTLAGKADRSDFLAPMITVTEAQLSQPKPVLLDLQSKLLISLQSLRTKAEHSESSFNIALANRISRLSKACADYMNDDCTAFIAQHRSNAERWRNDFYTSTHWKQVDRDIGILKEDMQKIGNELAREAITLKSVNLKK